MSQWFSNDLNFWIKTAKHMKPCHSKKSTEFSERIPGGKAANE